MTQRTRAFGAAIVASLLPACGDGGQWVEAPETLTLYEGMDRIRQMQAQVEQNQTPKAESRSCQDLLGQMREHIAAAESNNVLFQHMVRRCGDLGMQFGGEVRCESRRLQVKCK